MSAEALLSLNTQGDICHPLSATAPVGGLCLPYDRGDLRYLG